MIEHTYQFIVHGDTATDVEVAARAKAELYFTDDVSISKIEVIEDAAGNRGAVVTAVGSTRRGPERWDEET